MPKKSPRQKTDEARLIGWYKWEFLRRNPDYRKDYNAFLKEFRAWFRKYGYWYDQRVTWDREQFQFFGKVIAPRAKIICERWQIQEPLPAPWEFKKSGSRLYNSVSEVLLPTDCSKEEAGGGWDLPDLDLSLSELIKCAPESTAIRQVPWPDYDLELGLDLRQPLSSLLREATERIKDRKRRYDRRHAQPSRVLPSVRRRLDVYDTYLKVWDLRTAREKFEVIGARLFPDESRRAQRAQDSFNRAKALINGGYKELR